MVAALCYCIKTDKVCSGKPPENLPLCDLHLKLIPTVETETETKRFGNCYGAGTFWSCDWCDWQHGPTEVQLCCESLCRRSPHAGWIFGRSLTLCHRLDPKTTHSHNEIRQHLLFLVYTDIELLYVWLLDNSHLVLYAFCHLLSVTGLAISFSDTKCVPHRKWLIEKTSSTKRDRSCRVLGISWWDEHP